MQMKIKDIATLAKKEKELTLIEPNHDEGVQWIRVGNGLYPLYGMPKLDTESIITVLDISDRDAEKITVYNEFAEKDIEYTGYVDEGEPLGESAITISLSDIVYKPIITSRGLMFIKPTYLKPIYGEEREIYERKRENGEIYFSIQHGTFVIALLWPEKINMPLMQKEINLLSEQLNRSAGRQEDSV